MDSARRRRAKEPNRKGTRTPYTDALEQNLKAYLESAFHAVSDDTRFIYKCYGHLVSFPCQRHSLTRSPPAYSRGLQVHCTVCTPFCRISLPWLWQSAISDWQALEPEIARASQNRCCTAGGNRGGLLVIQATAQQRPAAICPGNSRPLPAAEAGPGAGASAAAGTGLCTASTLIYCTVHGFLGDGIVLLARRGASWCTSPDVLALLTASSIPAEKTWLFFSFNLLLSSFFFLLRSLENFVFHS
ncbi:unnamed protein product [Heligmosomoides polygyrus]|uniref:Small capsomere-interacting protein n=1 Tax=Heligmosomoides polygyrus TaxID=6339 RepID=A0A183FYT8_HELPZ|nr:unnamed protein product [Heligmosomoides polygyrus]